MRKSPSQITETKLMIVCYSILATMIMVCVFLAAFGF